MLSSQAWNAFLKTLEEPPPNTIFVLATTEAKQGPADGRRPLPPLRLQRGRRVEQLAAVLRARRRARRHRDRPRRASRCSPATRPARSATRSARSSSSSPTAARRSRSTTCSPCSASPTPTCCSARSTRSPRTTRAPRCWRPRGSPERAATSAPFMRDLEAHARELLVVQTLGEVPGELRVTPEHDARLAEQAARVGRGDVVRLLDLLAAAMERGQGRRRRAHAARARARQGGDAGGRRRRRTRCSRGSSGSRRGSRPPAPRRRPPPRRRLRADRGRARAATPPAPARRPRRRREAAPRRRGRPPRRRPSARERRRRRRGRARPPPRSRRRAAGPPAAARARDCVAELWPAVLDAVRAENAMLGARARHARPVELRRQRARRSPSPQTQAFTQRKAERPEHRAVVAEARRAPSPAAARCVRAARARDDAGAPQAPPPTEDELVARFMAEFDAEEIVPTRRRGRRRLMPQPPNMQQMLQQVQKMQQDMMAAQEQLKHEDVEASAGGGMVKVKVSGDLVRQVDHDRPGGGRPRRPRAAPGHGPRRRQRGAARGAGARRSRRWAGSPAGWTWAASARACPGCDDPSCTPPPVQRLITELGKLPGIGAAHGPAAGVPHPARRRRGRQRAGRRDPRGQGAHRPVRGLLQPRRRAALPDLPGRAPRHRR